MPKSEERKQYEKQWRLTNKEKYSQRAAEWRAKNPFYQKNYWQRKRQNMDKPYIPTQDQINKMRDTHCPGDTEGRTAVGHLLNTIQQMKDYIDSEPINKLKQEESRLKALLKDYRKHEIRLTCLIIDNVLCTNECPFDGPCPRCDMLKEKEGIRILESAGIA